ncbi:hypothetical protein [Mycolicibacterium komossense]|uniref:Uncharacterized protein n=1 Tax=Mycolicibacterium komossense TaxID=1779 RepID=A0ABT3CA10_9MYCO|nr:hypothetical protein [Mycolicibacterium komossense]MCV7226327.1 hypothetical protein [Mycolicibacterium komossense]
MIARLAVFPVTLGVVLGAIAAAGSASSEVPAACDFTLSAPSVVEVSGTQMVTATLTPAACKGTANPKSSQVCIAASGASPGRCELANGYEIAQVYLSPYIPGVNYVANGTGCAGIATPSGAICSSIGPKAATL